MGFGWKNLTVVLGMGPSPCSLGAHLVLGVFEGARARVLESEHMLGSLRSCSGLMLKEYSANIKGSLNSIKCGKNTEKIGSSNFRVDISDVSSPSLGPLARPSEANFAMLKPARSPKTFLSQFWPFFNKSEF